MKLQKFAKYIFDRNKKLMLNKLESISSRIQGGMGYVKVDRHIQDAKKFIRLTQDYSQKAEIFYNENKSIDGYFKQVKKGLDNLEQAIDDFEDKSIKSDVNPKSDKSYNNATKIYDRQQKDLQKYLSNRNMIIKAVKIASKVQ